MMTRARATRRCRSGKPCQPALIPPAPQRSPLGNQAMLRRPAKERAATPAALAPPVVHHVLRGSGRPLDSGVRGYFERGLGVDLGAVCIHTNDEVDRSARAVDAVAFSAGPHLVFRAGRYAPSQPEGLQLLAHDLAHVAQSPQTAPASAALRVGESSAPEEGQAALAAERLAGGERADAQGPARELALRRQTPDDQPKETVKPLIPIPILDQFDVKPYGPAPGAKGPTP